MSESDATTNEVTLGEVYRAVLRIDEAVNGNGRPGLKQDVAALITWQDEHDKRHSRDVGTIRLDKKLLGAILTAAASVAGAVATILAAVRGHA